LSRFTRHRAKVRLLVAAGPDTGDALIIGGAVSHQEIATRSSIGYYIFTPPGYNERLIQDAGFHLLTATDTTRNAAAIAQRWHDARDQHREALIAIEGTTNFEGLQQFLACVATLCRERRLLRYLYTAQKPAWSSRRQPSRRHSTTPPLQKEVTTREQITEHSASLLRVHERLM
jgi:hypothetical protein